MKSVCNTPYVVDDSQVTAISSLSSRVVAMRSIGRLNKDVLTRLSKFFRIKSIYHSNAIEGNQLSVGETRLVVEQGLTITGKPMKDQAEAKIFLLPSTFLRNSLRIVNVRSQRLMFVRFTISFSRESTMKRLGSTELAQWR